MSEALNYHNDTKHSEQSIRSNAHYLDWDNKPIPFKIYNSLDPILLPREADQTGVTALSAVAQSTLERNTEKIPDTADLSRLLYFSAGITKIKRYPGGEVFFRAASCTGALYEIDLYLVCGDLPGLPAGVYHFGPHDLALRLLRQGDFRPAVAQSTASEETVAHAPLTIVCTGTFWRNAWKYRTRTYRHFGWDNGTLLANLLAMSTALGLPARLIMGFVDSEINRLLDLDTDREVAFSMVSLGHTSEKTNPALMELPALNYSILPLSEREVDYPELRHVHAASSLVSSEDVQQWRAGAGATPSSMTASEPVPETAPQDPIEQVILRRASSRRFKRDSITLAQLQTMLRCATQGIDADFLASPAEQLNELYVIVNAVEGVEPGAYYFRRSDGTLELLKSGDFRADATYLDLGQALAGDASAAVFMMADLNSILNRFGNRGYRAVQTEAGVIGGKLYLAAYAQHLGASGLTFFDDDVTAFFSPHAAGKSTIFLVAIGKGAKE